MQRSEIEPINVNYCDAFYSFRFLIHELDKVFSSSTDSLHIPQITEIQTQINWKLLMNLLLPKSLRRTVFLVNLSSAIERLKGGTVLRFVLYFFRSVVSTDRDRREYIDKASLVCTGRFVAVRLMKLNWNFGRLESCRADFFLHRNFIKWGSRISCITTASVVLEGNFLQLDETTHVRNDSTRCVGELIDVFNVFFTVVWILTRLTDN